MKKLVSKLAQERQVQQFVATHSSHISSRLDLRSTILLGKNRHVSLHELPEDTARFFMKAPDNNVLEFALVQRVIIVEGDAEFILTDAFYRGLTGRAPEHDGCTSSPSAARVSAVTLNWRDCLKTALLHCGLLWRLSAELPGSLCRNTQSIYAGIRR